MAKITFSLNNGACNAIDAAAKRALVKTVEALHTDVVQAQVMPFDTGTMQNESTSVDKVSDTEVDLATSAPYAARLYYHPEYNFNTSSNPNARGRWLEPWINGDKKDFCKDTFTEMFKKESGIK